MEIHELKKLVKNSTAVVVLEDNEPAFVVMNYQTYQNIAEGKEDKEVRINHSGNGVSVKISTKEGELEILDRINKEILALKDEIEKEEKSLFTLD